MKLSASDLGIGRHSPNFFAPIAAAVERVISGLDKRYGNRGFVSFTWEVLAENPGMLDEIKRHMTVSHEVEDHNRGLLHVYGWSYQFMYLVPGTPCVQYAAEFGSDGFVGFT